MIYSPMYGRYNASRNCRNVLLHHAVSLGRWIGCEMPYLIRVLMSHIQTRRIKSPINACGPIVKPQDIDETVKSHGQTRQIVPPKVTAI